MAASTSLASAPRLTFLSRDNVSSYATGDGIIVCLGRRAPSGAADVASFVANVERGIGRLPRGAGLVLIINDTSTPDSEARKGFKRAFPELAEQLVGAAFVLRARGFVSAAQRSIITTLMLATGNRHRTLATSDVEEAVKWTQGRLPPRALMLLNTPPNVLAKEILSFCDEELAR